MIEMAGSLGTTHSAVIKATTEFRVDGIIPAPIFLRRLRRLLLLRYQAAQFFDDLDVRLLDRCIFATFCDCRDLGVGDPARQLLREARDGGPSPLAGV
jgi:hypothetical protein